MKKKLLITTLLASAGVASAQPKSAEGEYKRGTTELKAGHVHEACAAFEASDKLDAKVETERSLASCYEQDGRPISAARIYRSIADKDDNAEHRKAAVAKATKLEAKAPKLRFAINPSPAGLVVKVDGIEVPATGDTLVDVGPHDVVATAPGYEGHASAPIDRDHQIVDVIIRMEPKETAPAPIPASTPATPPAAAPETGAPAPATGEAPAPMADTDTTPDHRKRNGYIVGAVGLGLVAGAVVTFVLSSNKFNDEHSLCPNSMCGNAADLDRAHSLLDNGHAYRGVSIGLGIGGVLMLAASGYLLMTPHKEESHVSLSVDHQSAGFAYTGRF